MTISQNNPITCYVGLTIVRKEVLARINTYKRILETALGGNKRGPLTEAHITLVPPFHTDYKNASAINMGCALSTLLSTSIINSTKFCIKGLEIMHFEGDTIIHFPVSISPESHNVDMGTFVQRVQAFREQIKSLGGEIRLPIPEGYLPHISVYANRLNMNTRRHAKSLGKITADSNKEPPLTFRATYPTLYAKYKGGYRDLTVDPNKV